MHFLFGAIWLSDKASPGDMDRRQSEVREQPGEFLGRNGPGSRRACQGPGGVGMLDTPKKQ